MRILVVNNFFWPRTTGSAHFSEDVAARYAAAGHEVLVVTTEYADAPAEEHHRGYRIVRVPCINIKPGSIAFNYSLPFAMRPKTIRKLRKIFNEFQPEVVHQNGQFFDLTFLSTWFAVRRKIPRVVTVHTVLTHDQPWFRRIIEFVDRTVIRWVNRPGKPTWISIDKRVDSAIRKQYAPGESRLHFIPVGLEPSEFQRGEGERVREQYGLGSHPVILSFGHVIPLRDRVPLVRALPLVLQQLPDVKVLVVGEVYTNTFMEIARELGVDHAIVVAGRVEHSEVPHVLAAADIEGHDHTNWGLGITTLEVMAAGVPVFAVLQPDNYPGVDLGKWPALELLASGEPEVLSASIIRLLSDEGRRASCIADQTSFVEELFSMEQIASQYLDVFERLRKGVVV